MDPVLQDFPELKPYHILSNVHPTGVTLGCGSYFNVEEVEMNGTLCAAKHLHQIFFTTNDPLVRKMKEQFRVKCNLFSTIHHPHIVQFLGVSFIPGLQLLSFVMERLSINLQDLLEQNAAFFPFHLTCSILRDVASGLSYFHERLPPVIHGDLSAANILLNSSMVAKIGGIMAAQVIQYNTSLEKCPGAQAYMPPEALSKKYGVGLDIFSFGITSIFTLTQVFPDDILSPTFEDLKSKKMKVRTELKRRDKYMQMIYTQLHKDHSLVQMIEQCLNNDPDKRPGARDLLHLVEGCRAEENNMESNMNRLQLLHTIHSKQVNTIL